jgi:ABC-type uncharacterized transport system YnjBCD substrate-binding protein
MGDFKITISGVGAHHNGRSDDAESLARLAAASLKSHGKTLSSATFEAAGESEDLLVPAKGSELLEANATPDQIMQFFAWEHLPQHLAAVSAPFGHLARVIAETIPRNAERTVALRKLLEAKDAAVRARLTK